MGEQLLVLFGNFKLTFSHIGTFQMVMTQYTLPPVWKKIVIVIVLLVIASIILGRFFCGWLCPFGFYMDVLTRIRKTTRLRHLHFSEKTNAAIAQSRYIIIAVILILSVIFGFIRHFWHPAYSRHHTCGTHRTSRQCRQHRRSLFV